MKVANLCHRRTKATTTAISFVSLWLDQAHTIRQEVSSAVTRVVTILSRSLGYLSPEQGDYSGDLLSDYVRRPRLAPRRLARPHGAS
ncbi:hypothetical protein K439DRAFT_1640998 [Ramaria rubella]|nr:hypothetical protein K439DRAFT_1640998 [Ramaria rubella]